MRPPIALALAATLVALTAAPTLAQNYQTAKVTVETIGDTVTLGGTVVPYKEVTLAAQVAGQVMYLAGEEGDAFQRGSILIGIDDDDLQAQRRAALANIYNADAAMQNARVQYSRELWSPQMNNINRSPGMGMPSMFDAFFTRGMANMTGLGSPWIDRQADLYSRLSGLNRAQSQAMQARAQLDTLDARLRDARMLAPFDGTITAKLVEIGDTVQPGRPLLRFAHTDYLRVKAEVPVRLVTGLHRGQLVPVRMDARGQELQARVSQIFPIADASRHTVTVKFDLPQGVAGGPGMYAEVRIPHPDRSARQLSVVPRAALVRRGSLPGVYVLDGDRISFRMVRVGAASSEDQVSILTGLQGGETVIVNPPAGLVSGAIKAR